MWNISELVIAFLLSSVTTLLVTPFIIKLAIKLGAIDKPDQRKIHNGIKPSMGGLAIVIGVFVGYLYLMPDHAHMNAIIIRSEEHTSELQSRFDLVCRLLLEKKKTYTHVTTIV